MSGTLRFPFRLTRAGGVAASAYGSEHEVNDAIFAIMHTQAGERPLSPQFGISDPAGLGIDEVIIESDVATNLADIGFDDVSISAVTIVPVSDTVASAKVEWERDEEDMGQESEDEEEE